MQSYKGLFLVAHLGGTRTWKIAQLAGFPN